MKSTAKVLQEARELIEKYGWIRSRCGTTEIGFCAFGALLEATQGGCGVFDVACNVLGEVIEHSSIGSWNDTPGRTKQQVINAFKRAEKAVS